MSYLLLPLKHLPQTTPPTNPSLTFRPSSRKVSMFPLPTSLNSVTGTIPLSCKELRKCLVRNCSIAQISEWGQFKKIMLIPLVFITKDTLRFKRESISNCCADTCLVSSHSKDGNNPSYLLVIKGGAYLLGDLLPLSIQGQARHWKQLPW